MAEATTHEEPLVYIVILNWNCHRETAECVKACQQLDYSNRRILILDNNSSDHSSAYLSQHFPDIEIIQTGNNLGFAAGNNIGIRRALSSHAEYVLILNPDTVVSRRSLTILVDALANNPSIGICGPRVFHGKAPATFAFDGLTIDSRSGYQWYFNMVDVQWRSSTLVDTDCVSGCSMLIRCDLLRTVGLFREDFFLYYEDVELCFRARDHGWQTMICTDANVQHDRDVHVTPYLTGFRLERSRIIFARLRATLALRHLVTERSAQLIKASLRRGKLVDASRLLLEITFGILCGLTAIKRAIPMCGDSASAFADCPPSAPNRSNASAASPEAPRHC